MNWKFWKSAEEPEPTILFRVEFVPADGDIYARVQWSPTAIESTQNARYLAEILHSLSHGKLTELLKAAILKNGSEIGDETTAKLANALYASRATQTNNPIIRPLAALGNTLRVME